MWTEVTGKRYTRLYDALVVSKYNDRYLRPSSIFYNAVKFIEEPTNDSRSRYKYRVRIFFNLEEYEKNYKRQNRVGLTPPEKFKEAFEL